MSFMQELRRFVNKPFTGIEYLCFKNEDGLRQWVRRFGKNKFGVRGSGQDHDFTRDEVIRHFEKHQSQNFYVVED